MDTNWTKIAATVGGALIVALQGVNLSQGVAISGTEQRVERIENDIERANNELNKTILANQEKFRIYTETLSARLDNIDKKLDELKKGEVKP